MESIDRNRNSQEKRREEKRRARQRAEAENRIKRIIKKIIFGAGLVGVGFLVIFWIINQFPKGPDYSSSFAIQGRDHIAVGSSHPPYNSNPPTSGWHYTQEANSGFYRQELPDEQLVHNLEHGHIWIAYRPTLSPDIISNLKKFAGGMVIVTPRSANDFDIALAAWGRLDKFNLEGQSLDTGRIQDFIRRYENHGPEKLNVPTSFN